MNNFNLSALNMFTTCIINYTQGARSESFLFMKLSWYIVLINEIIIINHSYICCSVDIRGQFLNEFDENHGLKDTQFMAGDPINTVCC